MGIRNKIFMGAKSSSNYSAEALKNFQTDYVQEKTIDDARFGRAIVYKNKADGNRVWYLAECSPTRMNSLPTPRISTPELPTLSTLTSSISSDILNLLTRIFVPKSTSSRSTTST